MSTHPARLGISTYAYFWQLSDASDQVPTVDDMLGDAHRLGLSVLQICDHAPIETWSVEELRGLRSRADALGVALEVGTRGIARAHLDRYAGIADALGSPIVRTMLTSGDHRPTPDEAVELLRDAADAHPHLSFALETYEQLSTATLLDVVARTDRTNVGICLDPANTVASLEHPDDVIDRCAAATSNVHVKDFAFSRQDGWVGFLYSGARFGEGMLDYDHLLAAVRPVERGLSQIIEHWVPWQGDIASTVALEQEWTEHASRALLARTVAARVSAADPSGDARSE